MQNSRTGTATTGDEKMCLIVISPVPAQLRNDSVLSLRRYRVQEMAWCGEREKEVVPARLNTHCWEEAGWGMQRYRHDSTHGWKRAGWGMQRYRHDLTHGWEELARECSAYRHDFTHRRFFLPPETSNRCGGEEKIRAVCCKPSVHTEG